MTFLIEKLSFIVQTRKKKLHDNFSKFSHFIKLEVNFLAFLEEDEEDEAEEGEEEVLSSKNSCYFRYMPEQLCIYFVPSQIFERILQTNFTTWHCL